ncbi:MAG: Deoxyhypusine synthase [Methanophagales archaeon]|nr:deoxyhypusine synthase [Methanophagales archaeon]MCU4139428.1 Deoxyhypusine synthase [Methanophagales archaeon]
MEGFEEENAVRGISVRKGMSVNELVCGMRGCAFGARRLAHAVDIYEEMLKAKATKFLGLAGALVPAGMRPVLAEMLRLRFVDVLVTTGANLVHDILEALGEHHYFCCEEERCEGKERDAKLREQGVSRIYDVVVKDSAFAALEDFLHRTFEKLDHSRRYSIRELLTEIGRNIKDEGSILRVAFENGIPVFCPALADSIIGLHAFIFKQISPLNVDAFEDLREINEIYCNASRAGVVILGGGVPKNFILQTALVAPRGGFDYAIQITTKTPEDGSLSGATLEEAISWGKLRENAKAVTVYCDATIALPIIIAALRERLGR